MAPELEPVLECARTGHVEKVREALDAGLPVDAANHKGTTLLIAAATAGHLEVVALLLERGADAEKYGLSLCRAALTQRAIGRLWIEAKRV